MTRFLREDLKGVSQNGTALIALVRSIITYFQIEPFSYGLLKYGEVSISLYEDSIRAYLLQNLSFGDFSWK